MKPLPHHSGGAEFVGTPVARRAWLGGEAKARLVRRTDAPKDVPMPWRCEVVLGRLDGDLSDGAFEPVGDRQVGVHFVEEGALQPIRWWNEGGVRLAWRSGASHVAVMVDGKVWFVGEVVPRPGRETGDAVVSFGPAWLTLHMQPSST